jgi:4-amino-4-deoxy-L-arabinose transferase-like glycosyltransferase
LNWDEVSLGYNAYSILLTGRDEYGEFLPLILRSYDDYKPALYVYFTIPFIAVFGLNSFAVRLPAEVFGTLGVFVTYFLVKEILRGKTVSIRGKNISTSSVALLVSFLLAISPWHIQFSRIAFESNVGLTWNILAALFFLKGLKKPILLPLSAFCFAIVPSIYQSDKVFTPLLFILLFTLTFRQIFAVPRRYLIVALIVGAVVFAPVAIYHLTNEQAFARAQGVSVFADQTSFLRDSAQNLLIDQKRGDILGLLFDNRRVAFLKAVIAGYIVHFDLNWLFIQGDLPRHHAPFMGLLYLWELPFLLIGIYMLVFAKLERITKIIIFGWMLLSPVPASITSGVPHAVRTLNFLPTFQIFVAFGLLAVFVEILKIKTTIAKINLRYFAFATFFLIILFNFFYYLNQYFVQQNYYTSADWQYGYKEAVEFVEKVGGKYDKIIVTNKPHLDQSYMFFLFFLHYPPHLYQQVSKNASGGFRETHSFGKYEFRPIEWNKDRAKKTLFVGRPEDFPADAKVLKTIYFLNNQPAIKIVEG